MSFRHNTKENFEYCLPHYFLIDSYVYPEEDGLKPKEEWGDCPRCGLKPKVWTFDNGRSTGCGCNNSKYDHFSVDAESIVSVHVRTGGTAEYNSDDLRKNWNHYCRTGEALFIKDYPNCW